MVLRRRANCSETTNACIGNTPSWHTIAWGRPQPWVYSVCGDQLLTIW